MSSNLLVLLDTLDGMHKAATSGEWIDMGDIEPWPGAVIATDGIGVTPVCIDPEADDRPADRACISALHNAYPRLAQALRAALTPATDGEREAREALGTAEHDIQHAAPAEAAQRTAGWGTPIRHLRHVLALLATERAKAADAARERDELRAQLAALRSVPGGVIRNVGDGRAVFSITLTTPPPHIGPDPVDVAARTRTLTPKVTP